MRSALEKRLKALEQARQEPEYDIREIHLINVKTGEVGAILHVPPRQPATKQTKGL